MRSPKKWTKAEWLNWQREVIRAELKELAEKRK